MKISVKQIKLGNNIANFEMIQDHHPFLTMNGWHSHLCINRDCIQFLFKSKRLNLAKARQWINEAVGIVLEMTLEITEIALNVKYATYNSTSAKIMV